MRTSVHPNERQRREFKLQRELGPDLVALIAVVTLMVFGVAKPATALAGFSNPAVITIAALFVVAAGIRETGGLDFVGRSILGIPRNLAENRTIDIRGKSEFMTDLASPIAQAFLLRFPSAERAAWLSPKRMAAWLRTQGYSGRRSGAEPPDAHAWLRGRPAGRPGPGRRTAGAARHPPHLGRRSRAAVFAA